VSIKKVMRYNKNMRRVGSKKGFTLVELSLSIAFISILSITVALIINDAISTYRRGVTLNQVNTTGMDIVDDLRAAIQNSPAKSVKGECGSNYNGSSMSDERTACEDDGARKFVEVKKVMDVDIDNDGVVEKNMPAYGAFCTGAYSYIWNSGYFYAENMPLAGVGGNAQLVYKDDENNSITVSDFRFLKIKDQRRAVCISAVNGVDHEKYPTGDIDISSTFDISGYGALTEEPEVILANDSINPLALYDLSAAAPASNGLGTDSYYSVSFILGTVQGGINVMSAGNFCKTPESYDSLENFDYCAINKFNFAAQATGG